MKEDRDEESDELWIIDEGSMIQENLLTHLLDEVHNQNRNPKLNLYKAKLNDLVDGVGKIEFTPTQGEIEKYNITTHYTVRSCGNSVSCSCKGFVYHNRCKHVNRIIQREKMYLNRRYLGISLALLALN